MKPDFAEIKKTTDLAAVVRSYGIELKKSGADYFGKCPFHDDPKASLSVNREKGLFHCFGCGAKGNVIQFVAKMENLSDREAAQKLLGNIPGVNRGSQIGEPAIETDPLADTELFKAILEHYHEALFGRNKRGINYLTRRGLADMETLRHFGVGFVDGSLRDRLSSQQVEKAQTLGLFNAKGNEKFYNRVVVPILDSDGLPVGLYGRAIEDNAEVKHLYLAGGHRAVWNAAAIEAYPDELIVTESLFDALALWIAGKRNVIASYGAGGWTSHHAKAIRKAGVKKIIFAYDNDERGRETAKQLAVELTEKENIVCHRIKWPDHCKDAVDYFTYHADADFKGSLETFTSLAVNAPKLGAARTANGLHLAEQGPDYCLFENGNVSYRVRGTGGGDNMKVIVTAAVGEKNHTDRLDLYASRSRKNFSGTAAWRLEIEAEKVEGHLLAVLDHLEKLRESDAQEGKAVEIEDMTEGERAAAMRLLESPNLLGTVARHLEMIGYVGEPENKKLAYLIGTSRRLAKPLSGIIRSQSGAGKSYLMECVAELMPPEEVHFFSRLTPQALYYLETDALQNKLLIVDERNGSEESEYPIRTLQTRKVLKLAVPVKDPNSGRIKTETLEIKGPIAYMESTTSHRVNPENENRCFEIYLDESKEQTERIFAAQKKARTSEGRKIEARREGLRKLHHHAQRLLRPLKVNVPYIDLIDFPATWLRGRRDFDRFLSLIEGVAFLHQWQRQLEKVGEEDCIIASPDDYAAAYGLAASVFDNTLGELPKPVADLVGSIEKMLKQSNRSEFSRREVREFTKLPDHLLKRLMRQVEDLEYVYVSRAPSGGSYRYRLQAAKQRTSALEGLTTPEELARKSRTSGTKAEQGQNRA